jgi:hypothetical protein
MKRTLYKTFIAAALCVASLAGAGAARAQQPGAPRPAAKAAGKPALKPGPGRERYAAEYDRWHKEGWSRSFPNLGKEWEILAPATPKYNCISHTIGVYHRWEWPHKPGKDATVADFDQLYGKYGYRRISTLDYSFDPRVQKIVLYGVQKGGTWAPTHGARMLADGTWTSKLGKGPLIRHKTPDSVNGEGYGRPIAVYIRVKR